MILIVVLNSNYTFKFNKNNITKSINKTYKGLLIY